MYSYVAFAVFALASLTAAAPLPRADGTLGGVVDAIAPITAGLGVTLNNLLGFQDSPSGGQGGGGTANSGGSSPSGGQSGGSSPSGGQSGGSSPSGGQSGGSSPSGGQSGGSSPSGGQGGSSSGILGGVVDALAPITGGVGTTVNNLAGFK